MKVDFTGPARRVTPQDIERAATMLRISVATMRAVMEIESRNSGFDAKRRPLILFEPHVFWRNLRGLDRDLAAARGLAYAKWGARPYPRSSDGNYARLAAAVEIDREAAFRSVSVGLGQVLGENFAAAGYQSAEAMFMDARESEGVQLMQMANFIRANGLADELRRQDWANFARRYNGPGYRKNRYDEKLARAFLKWNRILAKPRAELTAKDLADAGSRTVKATTEAKAAIATAAPAVVAALPLAAQVPSVVAPVQQAVAQVRTPGAAVIWAQDNWRLLALAALLAIAAYSAWRAWRAASAAEQARLDDARTGANARI